jgi:hypothetical protein
MNTISKTCPECGGPRLYAAKAHTLSRVANLWPDLGGFWGVPGVMTVVCAIAG